VIVPEIDIARVAEAQQRFIKAIEQLTDEQVRRASLLPGWTVGHVLTHVARNADSHVRRADAAVRGEVLDQYEGGYAGRKADIEAGSLRSTQALVDDVRRSARAVDETWHGLPLKAWTGRSRDTSGMERPLFELPSRRWQEVEVHLVDLDVGISHRDWSDEFVSEWLPRTRERMWRQMAADAVNVEFDLPADELAWFYGRLAGDDLPKPPPWS
jgi:maleylpyruvate isomerase